MSFQKCWIVLLLCLTYQVHCKAASQLTEHKATDHAPTKTQLLSTDLVQQLERKIPKNRYTQWLLDFLLVHSQTPRYEPTIDLYIPYTGQLIGLIQLDKQGVVHAQTSGGKRLASRMLPTTQDWVILNQLSFVSGDTIAPQQLIASQERLNALTYIKAAQITVQADPRHRDTVNVHIATKDRFPIDLTPSLKKPSLSLTHKNLFGWGHLGQCQVFYEQGIGYNLMYSAPHAGISSEFKYLNTAKKGIKRFRVFKKFTAQPGYAGKVEISNNKKEQEWILDGSTYPQSISSSWRQQRVWLGATFKSRFVHEDHPGRLFFTGKVARLYFKERPETTKSINRHFHNHILVVGSIGFSDKQHYEAQRVYSVGTIEHIPYGSKVNLMGGYQCGEFVNRPCLRLDVAQGRHIQQLGHLYGAVHASGFWHKKAVEQGIVQLQLDYFTPLLGIGNQWIRQFVKLDYLAGYNMFTGELISTNRNKVATKFQDPFPGGTQRLYLGVETVLLTPRLVAGCQVAALGFIDMVRLKNDRGSVQQSSFCKALGVGFRCAHPHFSLGTLQVKTGYAPITKTMLFTIDIVAAGPLGNLDIGEPEVMSFQAY